MLFLTMSAALARDSLPQRGPDPASAGYPDRQSIVAAGNSKRRGAFKIGRHPSRRRGREKARTAPNSHAARQLTYRRFFAFAAIAVGVVLVPVLVWQLGSILLLAFAAILTAILLHVVSEPLQRWTPLPVWADLLIAGFIILGLIVVCAWIFGSQLSTEFSDVVTRVHAGVVQIQDMLRKTPTGQFILSRLSSTNVSVTGLFGAVVSTFVTAIEALIVIVMSAAYLAAEPALYRSGVVRLFGPSREKWANETIVSVAAALRYWLLGQFIQMAMTGILSALAVWFIGLPSPLALGLIAAATEFVPYLGPVLAAIPALLVAVTRGPHDVIWTLGAYILIHQIEGNLIMPQIQKRMVYIPPAVMLLGLAGIGALAGLLGFILAAPIVVAIFVVVQKAYVRDTLKEDVTLPADKAARIRGSRVRTHSRP